MHLLCSNFAGVALLVPTQTELTLSQLVFWPLAVNCAVLMAEAVLAALPMLSGKAVMLVTAYSAGLTGATTALLQAGGFVVASRFPAKYMQVCRFCRCGHHLFTYLAMHPLPH